MTVEILEDNRRWYVLINGLSLGEYFRSLGLASTDGHLYFSTLQLAQHCASTELAWAANNQVRPSWGSV